MKSIGLDKILEKGNDDAWKVSHFHLVSLIAKLKPEEAIKELSERERMIWIRCPLALDAVWRSLRISPGSRSSKYFKKSFKDDISRN